MMLLSGGDTSKAINFYKYKGLEGIIYLSDYSKINIKVKSVRKLEFIGKHPEDVKNFFETLWITRHGRKAIIHLLKSKSRIYIEVSDSIGALVFKHKAQFMYAVTDPDTIMGSVRKTNRYGKVEPKLIQEYDGKQTWEAMHITLFKGTFNYGEGDSTSLFQDKIIVSDYNTGHRLKGAPRDSAIKQLRQEHFYNDSIKKGLIKDPKLIADRKIQLTYYFHSCREFYYLNGIHEIVHTTTKNIALSRKNLDAEPDAYKAEKKAKRKLRKVLKSKLLKYNCG